VVWSPALLTISENPQLEKIEFWGAFQADDAAMLGTGLFFTGARSHQRLVDLIKAGTSVFYFSNLLTFLFHDSDANGNHLVR
jgi:hypothetical protein